MKRMQQWWNGRNVGILSSRTLSRRISSDTTYKNEHNFRRRLRKLKENMKNDFLK